MCIVTLSYHYSTIIYSEHNKKATSTTVWVVVESVCFEAKNPDYRDLYILFTCNFGTDSTTIATTSTVTAPKHAGWIWFFVEIFTMEMSIFHKTQFAANSEIDNLVRRIQGCLHYFRWYNPRSSLILTRLREGQHTYTRYKEINNRLNKQKMQIKCHQLYHL